MIPLLMLVPAYETRLGPFLNQEETRNIFQEGLSLLCFHNQPSFQRTSDGVVSVLCVVIPGEFICWPSLCVKVIPVIGGGSVSWRVSEWPGEWAQCPPQAPMARILLTSLERAGVAISVFYISGCPSNYSASSKKEHFISDKGERKCILKKVFLWPFCFDFFILLAFISFIVHPQWSLKSNQLFGISLVMKKKYWGSLISTVLASFEEWFPYLLLHLSQFSFWKDCVLNTSCVCSPLMPQITRFETQTLGLWTVRIWMSCLTTARCNFLSGKMVIMYEKFVVRPRWGNERAGYITRSSRKVFITRCQRGT